MESINNNRYRRIVRSFGKNMANNEQIDWGFWIIRLIALIIDSIITGIIGAIIFYLVLVPLFWTSTIFGITIVAAPWWAGTFILPFIYGIILVIYSAVLESTWNGMTIGKKLFGLQVQTTSGGKVSFDKAFIRNISKIYWLLLLLDWLLGIISPNKRQRYFDNAAGTMVVQTKQTFNSTPPPPPPPPT
jgi:uncharacterized RDD family membrane protein YckC